MSNDILPKLEKKIKHYKDEHHGEMPLYILVSSHDADGLFDEVRKAGGYDADTLVTIYRDCKIVRHDSLDKGELMLTNDLPETSS